jgi:hypothetical protein
MLRKLIVFAITSGLAAKLYRRYLARHGEPVASVGQPATRRQRTR